MDHYECVIVGSGPAGHDAALGLAGRGRSVAVIEKDLLGGVCLNRGCIPTKITAAAAKRLERRGTGRRYGIEEGTVSFSHADLAKYRKRTIARLRTGLEKRMRDAGITIIGGEAGIAGPGSACIVDDRGHETGSVAYDTLIIAAGAEPVVPAAWAAIEGIVDSERFWDIEEPPREILIVGGGVIGCEYASALATLGHRIILVEQETRLLPMEEPEVSEAVLRSLKGRGVAVFTGTRVDDPVRRDGALAFRAGERTLTVSLAICSMGRRRRRAFSGMDLSGAEKLRIKDTVWIAGDIAPGPQLAHKASHDADCIVDTLTGHNRNPRYDTLPLAIFTSPEAARAGLVEVEAADRGSILTRTVNFAEIGKAVVDSVPQGFLKMVVDRTSKKILGMTILGHEASEFSGYASLVLHNEMTVEALRQTVFAHPTLGEIFRECAGRFA